MGGLWRNDSKTRGGKYLVVRRDGSIPAWPWFVLGARDPAAPFALSAYASACEDEGMDPAYVRDVRALSGEFYVYAREHGHGDPTAPPESKDNPAIVQALVSAGTGETRYRHIAEALWHLLEKIENEVERAGIGGLAPPGQVLSDDDPRSSVCRLKQLAQSRTALLVRSAGENATLIPVEVPR